MGISRRDLIICAGGALAASALPARAAGTTVLSGPAFGTSWTLVAPSPLDETVVRPAIEEIVSSVDAAMSPFRANSELSRFNRSPSTDWLPLSAPTLAVAEEALRIATSTGGAFNPTLGPLVGRYGFGPIKEGATGRADEISVTEGAVRKARSGLTLDFNGIAKGYALDRIAASCVALGVNDFLLELGGEVFADGRHPTGRRWQIGVERPSPEGSFQRVVAAEGAALATSGSAVNAYAWRGHRYAHIIDPATGRPAAWPLASVTVVATTGMTADALATALYAMGPERGPDFASGASIEALFVMDDGREVATAGFEKRILA